jgi:hypothetical protein
MHWQDASVTRPGDWAGVFEEIAAALRERIGL